MGQASRPVILNALDRPGGLSHSVTASRSTSAPILTQTDIASDLSDEGVVQMLSTGRKHASKFHAVAVNSTAEFSFKNPAYVRAGNLIALVRQE